MTFLLSLVSIVLFILVIGFYMRFNRINKECIALKSKLMQLEEENTRSHVGNEELFYQSRLAQMGEMISMIAHQWRQPLSAISLTAIGLETKIRLNKLDFSTPENIAKAQEYILGRTDLIAQYVNSMTTTIDDFRMFYKKDRQKELVAVEDILDRTLKIIGVSLETQEIEIQIEYNDCPKVWLFPNEVVQVFLNLLQNAQDQFTANRIAPAIITIHIQGVNDGIEIKFTDNAGGIEASTITKIFRPYFSTKEKQNGTGLGLYMSKTIIDEHHGGQLSVSTTSNGDGACFTIFLPMGSKE